MAMKMDDRLTVTNTIHSILLSDPSLSTDEIAVRLADSGFPVPTDFCISQIKGTFLRTLKFLDRAGLLLRQEQLSPFSVTSGGTCEVCGGPINAARSTKRYCSTKCRVASHRKRIAVGRGSRKLYKSGRK